jgi:hypothetical protein
VELVELEVGRHDWGALRCGCQKRADHLATMLVELARAQTTEEANHYPIEDHVLSAVYLTAPAILVASVALAALSQQIPDAARVRFSQILLVLAAGEGTAVDPALAGRDMVAECHSAIRNGLWTLYAEVMHPTNVDSANNAFETLSIVEADEDRLERVRAAAADHLGWDLRP